MISKEEIQKLADLARIKLSDAEIEKLKGEIGPILDYVGQVKSVASEDGGDGIDPHRPKNVMRDDENPNESGKFSKELIGEFPQKEGDYLKVKKIL